MRFWFDTEFEDHGTWIDFISIGIVAEDGRKYYAESAEYDRSKTTDWLKNNVIPLLDGPIKPKKQIAADILLFVGNKPEWWAYFAAHDWVILCQLFGPMATSHPHSWPMFCMDLQQLRYTLQAGLIEHTGRQHHALDDAIWAKNATLNLEARIRNARRT